MHFFSKTIIFITVVLALKPAAFSQDSLLFSTSTTEKLNYPYGTVLTLQVEIVDGEQVKYLMHRGSFLFRIKAVNDTLLTPSILMEFRDMTFLDSAILPSQIFELYKYFYGTDTISIRSDQNTRLLKSKYVGRKFTVVGYESAEFAGTPYGVLKYQPLTSTPFQFRHYIVVIAKIFENDWPSLKGSLKK